MCLYFHYSSIGTIPARVERIGREVPRPHLMKHSQFLASIVVVTYLPVMWAFADVPTMAARESQSEDSDEWWSESEDDDESRAAPPWPFTGKPGRLGDNGIN